MAATVRIAILANAAKAKAEMKDTASHAERMGERFRAVGDRVKDAGKGLLKAAGSLASFASLLGPASAGLLGVAHGLAAVGQGAAALAPLAAFAPSLIGGFLFLKATLTGIGTAMGAELKPVVTAFQAAQQHAGALASQGIAKIGEEFNKVNMPNIAAAMDRIGVSANTSAGFFGKWVNSAPGMKLVKDTTDGVASAFENAMPSITAAAISFGNMANRANIADRFAKLGDTIGRLADKFNAWTDSVSASDIDGALTRVGNAVQSVKDKFQAFGEFLGWLTENTTRITVFSDAMAGLGIAIGIATGNPIAIAIGAFSLLINHWDQVKAAFGAAASWWSGIWAGMKASPELQAFATAVSTSATRVWQALKAAFDQIIPVVMPPLRALGTTIMTQVVPALTGFITAATPIVTFLIGVFGPIVAQTFAGVINVIRGALTIISGVIKVFTGLLTGDWTTVWNGIKTIVSGALTIIAAVVTTGAANVRSLFSALGPALQALAVTAWNLVKSAFSSGISTVLGLARALPGQVKSAVGNLGGLLVSAGRDLVNGLMAGIRAMAGAVAQAARSVVEGAVNAAKSALKIGSPSKVFATMGKQTGQGYVIGLQDQFGAAKQAAQRLVDIPSAAAMEQGSIDVSRPVGGAAGSQPSVIRIDSGGSRMDDLLVEILRNSVRARGGDVQLVLGRG